MKSTQLTVSDPKLIAEFIRPEAFKAFFERRIEVPPDHLGLLMRDGKFVQAYTGAHFSVGGIFTQLKGIIGGSHSISLLLADLKSFQVKTGFTSITKDAVQVQGTATIDLQIDPERPQNIIGLMNGRTALSKDDVGARIRDTLVDRVFEASIGRMNATEVRGNRGLQDLIQADTMKEIERVLGDLGVLIRHSSVEWALNDVEKAEMARAAAERTADETEYKFKQLKREMERQNETTEFQIASKLNVDKINLTNEHDLEMLVQKQEIDFVDGRETGKRMQEMQVLEHEIAMLQRETMFKFQREIEAAQHSGIDLKKIEAKRLEIERDIATLNLRHELELNTLRDKYANESAIGKAKTGNTVSEIGFQTRKGEADAKHYETARLLESQIANDKAAIAKLEGLNDLQSKQDRQRAEERIRDAELAHKREMDKAKLEVERQQMAYQFAAKMTPEQTLAHNAGLNPAVAKVLEEQAKAAASAQGGAQAMDIMRQMVAMADRNATQTAEQAKALAAMIVQSSVGVAAGVGAAKAAGASGGPLGATDHSVDCPHCGRENDAKDRFCVGCGKQLRT